jgi:hypothetical protein
MTHKQEPRKNAANTRKPRGRPFQKGNGGRPRGSRNKVSILMEQMIVAEAEEITRALITKAKGGNTTVGIALLRTLLGPARERSMPIKFKLPPLKTPQDALAAIGAIADGIATGALDSEGARTLTTVVAEFRGTLAVVDQERRLIALEARHKTI